VELEGRQKPQGRSRIVSPQRLSPDAYVDLYSTQRENAKIEQARQKSRYRNVVSVFLMLFALLLVVAQPKNLALKSMSIWPIHIVNGIIDMPCPETPGAVTFRPSVNVSQGFTGSCVALELPAVSVGVVISALILIALTVWPRV
jgi:hypothetical protein